MNTTKNLIACGIFKDELESVLPNGIGFNLHWIDAALHADPEKMEQELSTAISDLQETEQDIRLLFGNGCHPDMCTIADTCGAGLSKEKNCIQIFLGSEQTKELEKDRTMIISPGWLEAWQGIMGGLNWDEVDVRINMGRYDKIILIDPGIVPLSDETIIEFYDLVQVPVEILEINLDCFRAFVERTII